MKTMGDALSSGEQGPRRHWIGHRAAILLAVLLPVGMATEIPTAWFAQRSLSMAFLLLFGGVLWQGLRHDARLCEQCVAAMPLDGSAMAERQRVSLRMFHLLGDPVSWSWWRRVVPPPLSVGTVSIVVALTVQSMLFPDNTVLWRMAAQIPGMLVGLLVLRSTRDHSRLMVWCPRCRDGGGGIAEPSPDPVIPEPAPAGVA